MNNQVSILAFRDISKWLRESNIRVRANGDVWVVTPQYLNTKEQRRLNRELGITKINYTQKAMNRAKPR